MNIGVLQFLVLSVCLVLYGLHSMHTLCPNVLIHRDMDGYRLGRRTRTRNVLAEVEEQPFKDQHRTRAAENGQRLSPQ